MLSFFYRLGLVVTINSTDEESSRKRADEIAKQRYYEAGYFGLAEEPQSQLVGTAKLPEGGTIVTWDRESDQPKMKPDLIRHGKTVHSAIKSKTQGQNNYCSSCNDWFETAPRLIK